LLEKKCAFCGIQSESQEHILAQWLRAYFPAQRYDGITTSLSTNSIEVENSIDQILTHGARSGIHSSYGITTHKVCVECNSGWLGNLEEEIKTILVDKNNNFITEMSDILRDKSKSYIIAKWSVIKALLIGIRENLLPIDVKYALEELYKDNIPDGFAVELANTTHYGLNYNLEIVGGTPPHLGTFIINQNEFKELFYKFVLHIGYFFLRVSYLNPLFTEDVIQNRIKTSVLYPFDKKIRHIEDKSDFIIDTGDAKMDLTIFMAALEIERSR
jgi:hypothetical protein